MKKLLMLMIVWWSWAPLTGSPQSENDLRNRWFVVENGRPRPILNEQNHTTISFSIPGWRLEDSLKIGHNEPIDLWVNNQLFYRNLKKGVDKLAMIDLVKSAAGDSLFITIKKERYDQISTSVESFERPQASIESKIIPKAAFLQSSFYLYALIIILTMFALLKFFFPLKFGQLLSNPFSTKTSYDLDEFYTSFLAIENLVTGILFSFLGALQIIYINTNLHFWTYLNAWENTFTAWVFVAFIIFSFLVAKYILARGVAKLMGIRHMPDIQLQDFVQFLLLMNLIGCILLFVDQYYFNQETLLFAKGAYGISIIVLLSFQLWLYLKFVKFYSHRKLLIISYLCTTEFLPVFLIMYWLIK